jgi:tight adherence protein C
VSAAIIWSAVAGSGLALLLLSQPIGRARPSFAKRLAALRPDTPAPPPVAEVFATPGLNQSLVPILDGLGRLLLRLAGLVGLRPRRLARRLAMAGDPGGLGVFMGQKLAGALLGFGLLPACTAVGLAPFGPWPAWTWLAAALAGFVAPDAGLAARAARRRRELLEGLGTVIEFLTLAIAAGAGLEQALAEAATAGGGPLFHELAGRLARARLEGVRSVDALNELADQVDLPELAALAGALQAGTRQGTPVLDTLRAQATAARERRRLGLLEAGERAQVAMLLPIGLLILPAFFLVVLYPAVIVLLGISNP